MFINSILSLLIFFSVTISAQEIDTHYWYKIHNSYLGNGYSLSVKNNDDHNPVMDKSENTKNQKWKLIKEDKEHYRFINMDVGEYRSLANYQDGHNEPFLGKTGLFDSQFWNLENVKENTYRLTNLLFGKDTSLSINPWNKLNLFMDKSDTSLYNYWIFEKTDSVKATSEMSEITN